MQIKQNVSHAMAMIVDKYKRISVYSYDYVHWHVENELIALEN